MFQTKIVAGASKPDLYRDLARELRGLMSGERDPIANAANASALIYTTLPDLNWAGFYFLRSPDELVLGPFQGRPAWANASLFTGAVAIPSTSPAASRCSRCSAS